MLSHNLDISSLLIALLKTYSSVNAANPRELPWIHQDNRSITNSHSMSFPYSLPSISIKKTGLSAARWSTFRHQRALAQPNPCSNTRGMLQLRRLALYVSIRPPFIRTLPPLFHSPGPMDFMSANGTRCQADKITRATDYSTR